MEQNQENSKVAEEQKKQQYQQYVKEVTPMRNIWMQLCKAFVVGGLICVLGQLLINVQPVASDWMMRQQPPGVPCCLSF